MKNFLDFFRTTKEQERNQRVLASEFLLILGAIFLANGVSSLFPKGSELFIYDDCFWSFNEAKSTE